METMADRTLGIGASEIAAVCGLNPRRSALSVYLTKIGITEEPDEEERPWLEWGNRLEEPIAKKYLDEHPDWRVAHQQRHHARHDRPWMLATPDFEIDRGDGQHLLEVKTTNAHLARLWEDEVPEYYLVQCQWQMSVTGLDRCDLAVLIGGNDYRCFEVAHDADLAARLIEAGDEFWEGHVLARIPPEPDASDSAARALQRLYPRDERPVLAGGHEAERWADALRTAKVTRDAYQAQVDEAENRLKALIGDAAGIEGSWGRVTWKAPKPSLRLDAKGLHADPDAAAVVKKHMREIVGSRRFLVRFKEE